MIQLSIVIPIKNQEKRLNSLISMLSRCDLKYCEIIIVDNSDVAIDIDNLNVSNLDIQYYHLKNSNISKNLNTGIKHANGQFIARVDSHVIMKEDYFSNAIKILQKHPEIDFIGGYTEIVNQKLEKNIATRLYSSALSFGRSQFKVNEMTKFLKVNTNKIYLGVYRRSLFNHLNFNESIQRRQDGELNSKIKRETCLLTPELRLKYILIHDSVNSLFRRSFKQGESLTENRKGVHISHILPIFFYLLYLSLIILYPIPIMIFTTAPYILISIFYHLETRCNFYESVKAPLLIFMIHILYSIGIIWGLRKS